MSLVLRERSILRLADHQVKHAFWVLALLSLIALVAVTLFFYNLNFFNWQINSDDAFNFIRAIERFSVLEFRPHFPGYPAFIAVIHLFSLFYELSLNALIAYTSFSVLSIALISAYIVYLHTKNLAMMLLCFSCLILSPLLLGLSLSGLSDAPALMLLCLALLFSYQGRAFCMGGAVALMLATRPSYLPLAVSLLLFLPLFENKKKALLVASVPILVVALLSLFFLMSKDGVAYFSEGIRFTQGHFLIWGNTSAEQQSSVWAWSSHIIKLMGGLGVFLLIATLLLSLFDKAYFIKALAILTVIYLIYILVAQNPDNIRHFSPVYCLFLVLFFTQLHKVYYKSLGGLLVVLILQPYLSFYQAQYQHNNAKNDPTNQAINYLQEVASSSSNKPMLLATNYNVHWVKEQLKSVAVLDSYYPSSEITIKNSFAWRLSGSALNSSDYMLIKTFNKRLPTERTLYLYRVIESKKNSFKL